VLEMISFGSQTRITSNKHAVHCTLRFSWWNRRHHYTANDFWHVDLRSENYYWTLYPVTYPTSKKWNARVQMWQREGHNPLLIGLSSETLSKTTHRNVCNGKKNVRTWNRCEFVVSGWWGFPTDVISNCGSAVRRGLTVPAKLHALW
jgi:hypothetical protein